MKKFLLGLCVCGMMLTSANAAYDVFMRFVPSGNYEGESQFQHFNGSEGWFEITAVDFGIENAVNIGSISSGGGAGKAVAKDLTITKRVDSVSPLLFQNCAMGTHFDDAEIVFVRSGGAQQPERTPFFKIELKLVMIQDIALGASDGDDIVEESVVFRYGAQQISYAKQKQDGSYEAAVIEAWSFVLNTATFSVQ